MEKLSYLAVALSWVLNVISKYFQPQISKFMQGYSNDYIKRNKGQRSSQ